MHFLGWRCLPLPLGLALALAFVAEGAPAIAKAQDAPPAPPTAVSGNTTKEGSALGLTAAAALGIHAGYGFVQHDIRAVEIGTTLDLGHFSTRRLRLTTAVTFMRSFPHTERVDYEGKTYRAIIQDLNGEVGLTFLMREPTRRVVPFVSTGIAIHALSSAFQSLTLDSRYNTNNFALHANAGVRFRLGAASRRALLLSVQRVECAQVNRMMLRVGFDVLFNDLARAAR